MAREIASPKSTGGAGYTYADHVAAWWLLHLLTGRAISDARLGAPQRIRFEGRVVGWLLDDLVVEFASSGAPVRAAVSIKSGAVVTGGVLPTDFVRDCWELHLTPGATAFSCDHDVLVLATGDIGSTREALDEALRLSMVAVPTEFDRDVNAAGYANNGVRDFVAGFGCPTDLTGVHSAYGRSTGALLRAIRVQEFDFGRVDSRSERDALQLCREAVEDGDIASAGILWEQLKQMAAESRGSSASVDRAALLRKLREAVRLRGIVDELVDWKRLADLTGQWNDDVRDAIGEGLRVPRTSVVGALRAAVERSRLVVLSGESGAGKSAVIKRLVADGLTGGPCFVLHAGEVASATEHTAGWPRIPLTKLLPLQTARTATLVLDALDRLDGDETASKVVARVIRALLLHESDSPWRLVLVCQAASRDRVLGNIEALVEDLPIGEVVEVGYLDRAELAVVAQRYPALAPAIERNELAPVIGKPILLDILAKAVVRGIPLDDWAGESEIIAWLFEKYIQRSPRKLAHVSLLLSLSSGEADRRRFATPVTDVDRPELLEQLDALGLTMERNSTVRITHDLYADYARQRFLLAKHDAGDTADIVGRVPNPLWHRPIRLLGLHLLEAAHRQGRPPTEWLQLVVAFEKSADGQAGVDLVLEAIAFAAEPGRLLDSIRSRLFADEGEYLRKFLSRWMFATTTPLLRALAGVSNARLRAIIAAEFRRPDAVLWPRFLAWLIANRVEVGEVATTEFIGLVDIWLSFARQEGPNTPFVTELRQIVLSLAEKYASPESRWALRDRRRLFRLLLLEGHHFRERTLGVCRRLAGLVAHARSRAQTTSHEDGPVRPVVEPAEVGPAWPSGPLERADTDFQDVALTTPGAEALVALDGNAARDVFLALLIEPPDGGRRGYSRGDELKVQSPRSVGAAFHDFAPANALLRRDATLGLEFVLQLVEFATARWAEHDAWERRRGLADDLISRLYADRAPRSVQLKLDGVTKQFLGDHLVFNWHRGHCGSTVVAAVLMVLEYWLYEQLDRGALDQALVASLLRRTSSMAVLGVLFELALKEPLLLEGPLEPLVGATQLYLRMNASQDEELARPAMIGHMMSSAERTRQAEAWHNQPHRRLDFRLVVACRFVHRSTPWPAIEQARNDWSAEMAGADANRRIFLETLRATFDRANWQQSPDGTCYKFISPRVKTEEDERLDAEFADKAIVVQMPILVRGCIDEELSTRFARTEDLEAHLELVRDFDTRVKEMPMGMADLRESARCAVAALALLRFRPWLDANPAWLELCQSWIVDTCFDPPPSDEMDSPDDVSESTWDVFCADVLPDIWMERDRDSETSEALILLSAKKHYATVRRLATNMLRLRADPAARDDVDAWFHAVVWLARMRAVVQWAAPRRIAVDLNSRFRALVTSFGDRSLGPLSADWSAIASASVMDATSLPIRVPEGFDDSMLAHTFHWLRSNHLAPIDRDWGFGIVKNLTKVVVDRVAAYVCRATYAPYDADELIIEMCAGFAAKEEIPERRRELWLPWLDLPEHGAPWIESFLLACYRRDLSVGDAVVLELLREMHEHALAPGGTLARLSSSREGVDVASALVGAKNGRLRDTWPSKLGWLVDGLKDLWGRWARVALKADDCVRAFAYLLSTDAARQVRAEDGLAWLAFAEDGWEHDAHTREAVADLLRTVWAERSGVLGAQAPAFEKLLNGLVRARDVSGMTLAAEVAKRPG